MDGTDWHFLALADCYEPNRGKVSRKLSAKCHECRLLLLVLYYLIYTIITIHHIITDTLDYYFGLPFGFSHGKRSKKPCSLIFFM